MMGAPHGITCAQVSGIMSHCGHRPALVGHPQHHRPNRDTGSQHSENHLQSREKCRLRVTSQKKVAAMTINDLLVWLEQFEPWIGLGLLALPLVTYGLGALLKRLSRPTARYFLALAIYLAVVPGISMAVLILYMLFFLRSNLLQDLHLVFHILPVLSMGATLWAASHLMAFDEIPGFERLTGFMLVVGLSFAAILAIHKTRLGILFFAGFEHLLLVFVGFLVLWRLGMTRLVKSNRPVRR